LGRRPQVPARAGSTRRKAACWRGTRYGFNTRFGAEKGTNPEELIAAAHAGCFTDGPVGQAHRRPATRRNRSTPRPKWSCGMDGGPTICEIRLKTQARVAGLGCAKFRALADDAKQNCPVSKALSAVADLAGRRIAWREG
jgi:osmotically inducible protein OsmC